MIRYYEIAETDEDGHVWTSYRVFSTREMAEELKKKFEGLGGFGVVEENIAIVERELTLDVVEDSVYQLIESCKK